VWLPSKNALAEVPAAMNSLLLYCDTLTAILANLEPGQYQFGVAQS
jgi:hypothetical protein